MPRIELYNQNPQIQDQVHGPDIPVQGVGKQYGALAEAGDKLENLGMQLLQKRKEANDSNFAFNGAVKYAEEYNKAAIDAKKTLPEGADGYAEKMKQFSQDFIDKYTGDAPNEDAKRMFYQSTRRSMVDNVISAEKYENVEKAKKFNQDVTDNVTSISNGYIDNPNYLSFKDSSALVEKHIQDNVGTVFAPDEARVKIQKAKEQMAVSILHGLDSQERYGEAQTILKQGDKYGVGDALDPKTKAQFVEHFAKQVEQGQETRASTIHGQLKDMEYVALNGGQVNAGAMSSLINELKSNPKMPQDQKDRIVDEARTALVVGNDIQKLKTLPRSEWGKLSSNQEDPKLFNAANRGRLKEVFQQQAFQFAKEQEKDPVQTTIDSFPALKQMQLQSLNGDPNQVKGYLDNLVSKQKYLQIPEPKLISNDQASYLGNIINKSPNAEAAAQAITDMQTSFGKYFPQVFQELAAKQKAGGGGVDSKMALAGFVGDQGSRQKIVENVVNGKAIDKGFKDIFSRVDHNYLNAAVSGKVTDAINAVNAGSSAGGNAVLADSILHQVTIEAQKIMLSKGHTSDTTSDMKDAAEQAYQSIVGKNFQVVRGGKSAILMPNYQGAIPNNPTLTTNFVNAYSEKDGFKDLGVAVPESFVKLHEGDKTKAQDAFYSSLEKSGKWVSNPDNSGLKLVYDTGAGLVPVIDKNQKPIEKSFQDISHNPDQRTLKYSSGIFSGVLKKLGL